jgi:hypothetical protein
MTVLLEIECVCEPGDDIETGPGLKLATSQFKDGLDRSSAGHQVEDDADNGKHKEDVNPGADGVYTDNSEQPQNKQDNRDRPKHSFSPETCPAMISAIGR